MNERKMAYSAVMTIAWLVGLAVFTAIVVVIVHFVGKFW